MLLFLSAALIAKYLHTCPCYILAAYLFKLPLQVMKKVMRAVVTHGPTISAKVVPIFGKSDQWEAFPPERKHFASTSGHSSSEPDLTPLKQEINAGRSQCSSSSLNPPPPVSAQRHSPLIQEIDENPKGEPLFTYASISKFLQMPRLASIKVCKYLTVICWPLMLVYSTLQSPFFHEDKATPTAEQSNQNFCEDENHKLAAASLNFLKHLCCLWPCYCFATFLLRLPLKVIMKLADMGFRSIKRVFAGGINKPHKFEEGPLTSSVPAQPVRMPTIQDEHSGPSSPIPRSATAFLPMLCPCCYALFIILRCLFRITTGIFHSCLSLILKIVPSSSIKPD